MLRDAVAIIEACYAGEGEPDDGKWLEGVTQAAEPLLGVGRAVVAYLYELKDMRLHPSTVLVHGDVGPVNAQFITAMVGQLPPEVVEAYSFIPCMLGREAKFPGAEHLWPQLGNYGIADVIVVNGMDPTRHGVYLGAALAKVRTLSRRQVETWNRIASHLAAGYRLRRRLRGAPSEAILEPNGKIAHAEAAAQSASAQQALRQAAKALDKARGKLRKRDPDAAVDEWRGLIAARWSLVEHFERDGKRFLLAQRNDPTIADAHQLTPRELQAVGYASLGHTNKLIAYEMGISASTVGVLISRAIQRLGAKSRKEPTEVYRRSGSKAEQAD